MMRDREIFRFVRAATAIVLAAGLSVAVSGCRESGAGSDPGAKPVDQSQPAPQRRGSY